MDVDEAKAGEAAGVDAAELGEAGPGGEGEVDAVVVVDRGVEGDAVA